MNAGEAIRQARQRQRMSQQDLATKVGVSQPAIKKIEKGETTKSRHLPKIAQVLGLKLSEIDPSLDMNTLAEGSTPGIELIGDRNLPVYGTAEGGEGAMVVSSDPVEYTWRPISLATVKDGYAVIISGDSMEPEYWAGDIVWLHPHQPPRAGVSYVFYRDDGAGDGLALCKHLVKITPTTWCVRQWNPRDGEPRDFELSRKEWPRAHCVVGKLNRR